MVSISSLSLVRLHLRHSCANLASVLLFSSLLDINKQLFFSVFVSIFVLVSQPTFQQMDQLAALSNIISASWRPNSDLDLSMSGHIQRGRERGNRLWPSKLGSQVAKVDSGCSSCVLCGKGGFNLDYEPAAEVEAEPEKEKEMAAAIKREKKRKRKRKAAALLCLQRSLACGPSKSAKFATCSSRSSFARYLTRQPAEFGQKTRLNADSSSNLATSVPGRGRLIRTRSLHPLCKICAFFNAQHALQLAKLPLATDIEHASNEICTLQSSNTLALIQLILPLATSQLGDETWHQS